MSEGTARRVVAAIMAEQFGVAHRRQLLDAGMTRHSIQHDVAGGLLIPKHPGVYVDAAAPPIRERNIMAATLWGGRSAAAASVTAAGLLGLSPHPLLIDVATTRSLRSRPGIRLHRCLALPPEDLVGVGPIPVTAPVRTIIDLASALTEEALEIALEEALRRRLFTEAELRGRLIALGTSGRKGAGLLLDLLEQRGKGEAPTASGLETLVARAVRDGELPAPVRQHPVRDEDGLIGYLDFAYPWALLNLEADSFKWHTGRQDWRRELRKRNRLMRLNWRTRHVTYEDVRTHRKALITEIGELLRERSGLGGLRDQAAGGG
ncbi:MAG TPA: hypothetical protein VFA00_12205 [Actinomycetota bacterium]|jgi:hypothetical protein|nr:hypothetical protein [Actinomycetota bacterium]